MSNSAPGFAAQLYDQIDLEQPSAVEHRLSRDNPSGGGSVLPDEDSANFIVGIGGHHAPANARLFSYVLPAIALAQARTGPSSLTLTTSLTGAQRYNYALAGPRGANRVQYNTRDKLACLLAFVSEFFPNVFQSTAEYYGDVQDPVPDSAWCQIWDQLKRVNPGVCSDFLRGINRGETDDTKAYAVRHSFWFLDLLVDGDPELAKLKEADLSASVGSEKEALFNLIRRAILQLPLEFLEDTIGHTVNRRNRIFQLVFPTGNPVPYGEALKGKKGREKSAEAELRSATAPESLGYGLINDIRYTIRQLEELAGVSEAEFKQFLRNL